MSDFRIILIEHGYADTARERRIIEAAGGELIDAENLPRDEALRLCEDADGLLCRRIELNGETIRRFRRCKIIVRYGVGTDNVDVTAATEAGIIVGHVPHYCPDEVSSHAIALWLAAVRRVLATDRRVREGGWDVHRNEPIHRVAGCTFGLVGLGNIGRAVARKLAGWKLRLLAVDPYVEPAVAAACGVQLVSRGELLARADFISLHCPLLPETHHWFDRAACQRLKPGAILINTARGPLVEETALLGALESGPLAQAALDVFEEEPPPTDSPARDHPRIIVTDHTAWYSEESQAELQQTAAEEVARVCTGGLPRSLANPEVLRKLGRWAEWEPPENVRWQLKRLERLRESAA